MAAEIITELGSIRMNDDIIATIAGYAAVENYGIVGMNAKTVSDAVTQLFGKDDIKKGVKITINKDGEVDVDLFVTLEYGVSLPAVAANTQKNVRYRLEEMTGLTVNNINVHVEAIRVDGNRV
ncbi:MAG: Asp23/Gls24 family envelope stress response protein [Clostridia bacterium]|nr:Asp23/Gls24 family envelope stress response protein [Clostridia bacterium]